MTLAPPPNLSSLTMRHHSPYLPHRIMLLIALCTLGLPTTLPARELLIRDVTVVSPDRSAPKTHVDVRIRDGRIVEVAARRLAVAHASVIDGRGHFLTPGLIDGHVHLGSDGGLRDDQAESHPELLQAFHRQEPRSYLYFGFTHLVDLKQSEDFVAAWQQQPVAPGLSYCKGLPFPNGYGEAFLPEPSRNRSPYLLDDPAQHEKMPADYRAAEHSVAAIVAKVRATDARCVKTFYEEGFAGLWNWPVPSNELIGEVKQQAKAAGLVHVHHANSLHGYRQAVESGVDIIAHGLWHWDEFNGRDDLPEPIRELLDRVIRQGIAVQPTSQVLGGELRLLEPGFLDDPRLADALPATLIHWYRQDDAQWFLRKLMENLERTELVTAFLGHPPSGERTETSRTGLRRLHQVVHYLHEHGGRLVFGSDTPSSPTYTNPPGLSGRLELQWLADNGFTPLEILRMATLETARTFGLDDDIGSVEVGKRANLLLLDADPSTSVAAFDSISVVILDGVPIQRAVLSARHPAAR